MTDQAGKTVVQKEDGSWSVSLTKRMYEKQAVIAAAYKFQSLCRLTVEPDGEERVRITFFPPTPEGSGLEEIAEAFCREALDQQHRRDLNRQFGHLRDLIVEHAFAPISNLKERLHER